MEAQAYYIHQSNVEHAPRRSFLFCLASGVSGLGSADTVDQNPSGLDSEARRSAPTRKNADGTVMSERLMHLRHCQDNNLRLEAATSKPWNPMPYV